MGLSLFTEEGSEAPKGWGKMKFSDGVDCEFVIHYLVLNKKKNLGYSFLKKKERKIKKRKKRN